jgi:hypothetical protein
MGGGKQPIKKPHYCKICGKKVISEAKHMRMHKNKSKEKQQTLI